MLLQWCILEPSGPSNLAAIRFASPVRVQSITIFPTDSQPFAQSPEIIGRTEPREFFLEVFFNAQVVQSGSKEKPKPTNALVPTVIAYAGGQMDFSVNMSSAYATRLMIVRGTFESVSLAIYGDVASEMPPPHLTYEPRAIPSFEPIPIPRALDPSNSRDPTQLARQLLGLIPGAPPLPLIIRLMFCLKPSNDDWDLPEFPYLHPDLDDELIDFDLEKAFRLTARPVADDISSQTLIRFAENVTNAVENKSAKQSYLVAGILCHAASQHPELAIILLQTLDITRIFDSSNMDEETLLRLLEASASADIARHLHNDWFLDTLASIEKDPNVDRETAAIARQLAARIEYWATLEDAISNTQGDFAGAAAALKDLCSQEQSFGVWLESMVTQQNLVAKLNENPTLPVPLQYPPLLFSSPKASISHDEFVAFLRALIGVSSVLAVYAWADSLPDQRCRERTLGILRLWQGVDGYREILDHLLLLRQMIFRLECMLDNDLPTASGTDAEHILVNLAKNPRAILRPDFMNCIFSLKQPRSYITEDERLSMRAAALVADDGLLAAVEELFHPVERPPTLRSLRTLRVALAVVEREVDSQGEYHVMQEFWKEGSCGMVTCLVNVFLNISDEIGSHFTLRPPPRTSPELMSQLFRASDELLKLMSPLLPAYPLAGRPLRAFTAAIANLFVCTDAADMLYAQSSPACVAAQETRQSCIDIIRILANGEAQSEARKLNAEIVLRTLLEHGLRSEDRDPAHHLLQVFCLVDYLLPLPDAEDGHIDTWVQRVLPSVLRDLHGFCRVLDTENRAHFVRRLAGLDKGVIGIGEWLLLEELRELLQTLRSLEQPRSPMYASTLQYQLSLSLRFLLDLMGSSTGISTWYVEYIATSQDAAYVFAACLWSFVEHDMTSPQLVRVLLMLAHTNISAMDPELKLPLAFALMRSIDFEPASEPVLVLAAAHNVLADIPVETVDLGRLGLEMSFTLTALDILSRFLDSDDPLSAAVLSLLESFVRVADASGQSTAPLRGFDQASFDAFCDTLRSTSSSESQKALDAAISKISLANEPLPARTPTILPESLELSPQDLDSLLRPSTPPPSTPPRQTLNQDVLSLVAISPPTAVIRSPASTGLTKTYTKNDFRQLRQTPSARQNTSRLPSMHVDDFESSPMLLPSPVPPAPVSLAAPVPGQAQNVGGMLPFPDGFPTLSPVFKPL